MRILILTSEFDPFRGGIGTYARELAVAAVEQGHSVELVAPDYFSDNSTADSQLPFIVHRYVGREHTGKDIIRKIALVRKFAEQKFDVVHAVDWPFYIPLALSGFRRRSRCLFTFHGTEINYMKKKSRAAVLRLVGFWGSWATFVTNSRYTTKLLRASFPAVNDLEVLTVPLGISESWGKGKIDKRIARANFPQLCEKFVIISVGRIVPRKGHMLILEALEMMPDELLKSIVWVVVGKGEQEYVQQLMDRSQQGVVDVVFAGAVSSADLDLYLSASDLFCLPGFIDQDGRVEGFGLAYLEAAAFGLPSIAADVGGVSDAVTNGVSGIFVEEKSVSQIKEAISSLYYDRALLETLSLGAASTARRMTWTKVFQDTYDVPARTS